jgi:hypothetical protein
MVEVASSSSWALGASVVRGHVVVAGANLLVAGGSRRHAAAALAARVARPPAQLRPARLDAPVRARAAAICTTRAHRSVA